jgi:2-amino-4-hydroxy-6-hydroxymethyldihydropteridine diphosphokinase
MQFSEWEPYYLEIVEYFGFDRAADEEAACLLSSLLDRDNLLSLASLTDGNEVTVCGNAPTLRNDIGNISGIVYAADAAAEVLDACGIRPDVIFTDLDGATDRFVELNEEGTILVIHAHGDNMPLLKHWVPRFRGRVVGTTQAAPLQNVYNFGGFSDGDRAVFAADELGAIKITLAGFDLDDENVDPMKRGKLRWARKLLALIGIAA